MPIHVSYKKLIDNFKKEYKAGETECRDFTDGTRICASKKAWQVFFAYLNKKGWDDTKPIPKELVESKDIEPIIPEKTHKIKNCLILVKPHGRLVWLGEKTLIVKSKKFLSHIHEEMYLIGYHKCFGKIYLEEPEKIDTWKRFKELEPKHRITEEEVKRWGWKLPLYAYSFRFVKYPVAKPIELKVKGPQVFVKVENVKFLPLSNLSIIELSILHAEAHANKCLECHEKIVDELLRRGYPHVHLDELDSHYELIKKWNNYDPSKVSNKVLLDDHRIACFMWAKWLKEHPSRKFESPQFKDIPRTEQIRIVKKICNAIREEMKKRGMKPEKEPITRELWKLPEDMKIRDIDLEYVLGLTDKELIDVWKFLTKQKFEEDVYNAGVFVGIEMYKRGLWEKYKGNSKLAEEVSDEVQEYGGPGKPILSELGEEVSLRDVIQAFPSALVIENQPWAAYIAGRVVNEGKVPRDHDIDLIVTQPPDPRIIHAFKTMKPSWLAEMIHVVFASKPTVGNNIPIYKKGFFKTSSKEQVKGYGPYRKELSKVEPIMKFVLLKQKSGWMKNEFFNYEDFYKNWASKYLDQGIWASKKYDGRAFAVEKKGNTIAIITEDKERDRSSEMSHVVEELRSIPHNFILHAECVVYNCEGKEVKSARLKEFDCPPFPREDTASITVGHISPEMEKGIVFHVHDAIYIDKDIHNLPYKERFPMLKKLIPDKYQYIRVVESSPPIYTPRELKKWVEKLRRLPGSEGVFFRAGNATYPIVKSGINRSPLLSKIKNLKSIDVMVWNRVPKTEKETGRELDQYMYDCVYKIPCSLKDSFDRSVTWKGKCYAPIGRSYATSEKNERGDIIEILTGRIRKYERNGKIVYTWMFPKYREKRKDKKEPDTLDTVKKLAKVGPGPLEKLSELTVIKLKMCPYYKEEWCPLKKIFGVPRAHILADIEKEYLRFPVVCKLADVYRCWYLKSYYYSTESIYRED